MMRATLFPFAALAAIAAALLSTSSAAAQSGLPASVRTVPAAASARPFAANAGTDTVPPQILEPAQMTAPDRQTADEAWPRIAARAGAELLPPGREGWSYRQISCPALPDHLFLRYTRTDGVGNASRFTASISRESKATVHVVPLLRRGYSLFSPAPVNAGTVAVFNRIREEEPQPQRDWLGVALCYAALAGANPWSDFWSDSQTDPSLNARLETLSAGGALVGFTDRASDTDWELSFDSQGRLLKVAKTSAYSLQTHSRPIGAGSALGRPRTPPVASLSVHEVSNATQGK
jgi:hypothetical protein